MVQPVYAPNEYRAGLRKAGARVNIAAPAAAATIYQLTPGRTCRLKRLHVFNTTAVNGQIRIGTGLAGAFVQRLPDLAIISGTDRLLGEGELEALPGFEFEADITAQLITAGMAGDVMVEVEEYGA